MLSEQKFQMPIESLASGSLKTVRKRYQLISPYQNLGMTGDFGWLNF